MAIPRAGIGSEIVDLSARPPVRLISIMGTGDNQGVWQLWHIGTGRPIGPPLKHDWPAKSLSFSPDGRTSALDNEAHQHHGFHLRFTIQA